MSLKRWICTSVFCIAIGNAAASPAMAEPAGMYRLTEEQYRAAIAQIFGPDITIGGRFEPLSRRPHGLLAPGSYQIAVSPTAMEHYSKMARTIASQVVDTRHRDVLISCKPAKSERADDDCSRSFFGVVGPALFRRPLEPAAIERYVDIAASAAESTGSFYDGLALGLEAMLVSPRFLFQIDLMEADPERSGETRLDVYSKAARLSFFLWNTTPDGELLAAAHSGDLHDTSGLARQVDRLLASPRLTSGVRAFFSDMLRLDTLTDLTKDPIVYPQFIPEVKEQMGEQMLRALTGLLLEENRDYREIFTSRETYMTRALAAIYAVPVPVQVGWFPYEFPADDSRGGILTQMYFLAAFSHNGRSSPTLRGQAVREVLMCQAVPDPPGNVDFTAFEEASGAHTVRERLTAHRANPVCAGCHKITDPIGLSLENFDGIGVYRDSENGAPIDVSGVMDGVTVRNAIDLGKAVGEQRAATDCLVDRLLEYGTRRASPPKAPWSQALKKQFAELDYRLPDLLRAIVTSDAFYRPSSAATTRGN